MIASEPEPQPELIHKLAVAGAVAGGVEEDVVLGAGEQKGVVVEEVLDAGLRAGVPGVEHAVAELIAEGGTNKRNKPMRLAEREVPVHRGGDANVGQRTAAFVGVG